MTYTICLLACTIVGLLLVTPSICAPLEWKHSFPAGGQRGAEVTVKLEGTFERWPLDVWSDCAQIQAKATDEKGVLQVTVGGEVSPGVYWLRLHDTQGASSLRPFVVGCVAEINETEPNNRLDDAQQIDQITTINGRLHKRGEVDTYAVKLLKDQTLVVAMRANVPLGSPMDGVIQICNADSVVLAHNDDAGTLDPLLVYTAPADGIFYVRTFAFPVTPTSSISFAGADNFVYRLTLTTDMFIDHAMPLAVEWGRDQQANLAGWNLIAKASSQQVVAADNRLTLFASESAGYQILREVRWPSVIAADVNDLSHPQTISIPSTVSGRIESSSDIDVFEFSALKGEKLVFEVESSSLGFPLDARLKVTDHSGKQIAEADDTGKQHDPRLTFSPAESGTFRLAIDDLYGHGGPRYAYRLTIRRASPDFTLSVPQGEFEIAAGEKIEIPVAVTRIEEFNAPIEIVAIDLPAGFMSDSVVVAADAKEAKLVIRAAKTPARGPFRIAGRLRSGSVDRRIATFSLGVPGKTHTDAWVTCVTSSKK